jgi:hypothetical protein
MPAPQVHERPGSAAMSIQSKRHNRFLGETRLLDHQLAALVVDGDANDGY